MGHTQPFPCDCQVNARERPRRGSRRRDRRALSHARPMDSSPLLDTGETVTFHVQDKAVRRAVKRVALVCFTISLRRSRWQRRQGGATPYDLGGSCQGCGTCCEAPAIRVGRATWYLPTLRFLFWRWHETVNRFHLQSTNNAERTFVFSCEHLDWSARRCDSYDSRPGLPAGASLRCSCLAADTKPSRN